jgi:hypothetical protein
MAKNKKTYADEARAIMNRYKLRLGEKFDKGDTLALEAMNQELAALRESQEGTRMVMLGGKEYRGGGKLKRYQDGGFISKAFDKNRGIDLINDELLGFTPDTLPATSAGAMAAQTGSKSTDLLTPFKSRVPWLGAVSNIAGSLLMNKDIDLPSYDYEEYDPTQIAPHLVDYSRGREQTLRERDIADARIRKGARGLGSRAGLMENITAGTTGTQRVAGTAFNQSLENEQNVNAQILNEVGARNAQAGLTAAQMNARNKLFGTQIDRENAFIKEQRRQNRIGGIVDSVTGYGKDLMAADQYDQMLNMMAPENYTPYASRDSRLRRLLQISPEMNIGFRKTT